MSFEALNKTRTDFWQTAYSDKNVEERITGWVCHKVVSVVSLPISALEWIGSVGLFLASASTIGTSKIVVYAVSLGNVELPLTVGFEFFMEHAFFGFIDLTRNVCELVFDTGYLVYKVAHMPLDIARFLGFEGLLQKVMAKISKFALSCLKQIGKVFEFFVKRLNAGFDKACESEKRVINGTPFPLNMINDITKSERIDFRSQERSFASIFKHYVLSVANIPLNAGATVALGGVSLFTGSAFLFKAALYSATNINIAIPTFAGQTIVSTGEVLKNAVVDTANDLADIAVTLYKISDAIGIVEAVVKVAEIIAYIPKAIFG